MSTACFFAKIRTYADLSQKAEQAWAALLRPNASFRHDDAMKRYRDFIRREPDLHRRLKQHHIAGWLGITPESLSRLRKAIALGRM